MIQLTPGARVILGPKPSEADSDRKEETACG
jgi:hypothetical protein